MPDPCIFCDIGQSRAPADILYRDDHVFVIRDIAPKAPTHLLIIPHQHLPLLSSTTPDHEPLLGHLFIVAEMIAKRHGLADDGYRLVVNQGNHAGMGVAHLHMHLLGGAQLGAMG